MDRPGLARWIGRYEQLWRTPGTDGLVTLFSPDATYRISPWREPIRGIVAITAFWAEGSEESFTFDAEVVAVDGDTGVARVAVDYAVSSQWRDLWIVQFDQDGRCRAFEEWPFAPGQRDGQE